MGDPFLETHPNLTSHFGGIKKNKDLSSGEYSAASSVEYLVLEFPSTFPAGGSLAINVA